MSILLTLVFANIKTKNCFILIDILAQDIISEFGIHHFCFVLNVFTH